jgi:flagellar hook-associated protein 3 FlgL
MLTNLDPEASLFVAQLNRLQQRIAQANSRVTSGKRITVASDAPDEISTLLQLRAGRQHNSQVKTNLAMAATEAGAADDALAASIRLMDTALSAAAQGSTSTLDATGRETLAEQAQAILQQMVGYSRTAVQGRYIFSGDEDGSPQYQYDATAANPVVQLASGGATREIEDPGGGSFRASKTAQDIFDSTDPATGTPAADNVFASLSGLILALQANDPAAVANVIPSLKAAAERLNSMEAFYGNVQARIQDAASFADQYDTKLQTQISAKEDADVPSAALELTQANTQMQAAFEMRAQRPKTSLFNYLG